MRIKRSERSKADWERDAQRARTEIGTAIVHSARCKNGARMGWDCAGRLFGLVMRRGTKLQSDFRRFFRSSEVGARASERQNGLWADAVIPTLAVPAW